MLLQRFNLKLAPLFYPLMFMLGTVMVVKVVVALWMIITRFVVTDLLNCMASLQVHTILSKLLLLLKIYRNVLSI